MLQEFFSLKTWVEPQSQWAPEEPDYVGFYRFKFRFKFSFKIEKIWQNEHI